MYVLDTDHIGVLQRASGQRYHALARRMNRLPQSSFYVTIVSFHEQILGWTTYIARARDATAVVTGYARLDRLLTDFARARILQFNDPAAATVETLRRQRVRVGTMDLRIAAIALVNQMTVLTSNLVDFQRVPGLHVEDWTM